MGQELRTKAPATQGSVSPAHPPSALREACWVAVLCFGWYSQAFLYLGEGPVEGQTWVGSTGPESTERSNP